MCSRGTTIGESGFGHVAERLEDVQPLSESYELRLTMKTVLSSIKASSPVARKFSSCFTS
jgi:hypothetical protein